MNTLEKSILEAGGETGHHYSEKLQVTPAEAKIANAFLARLYSKRVQLQNILRVIRLSFSSQTQYYQWIRELKSRIRDRNIEDVISAYLQRCKGLPYKQEGQEHIRLLTALPNEGEITDWVCELMGNLRR